MLRFKYTTIDRPKPTGPIPAPVITVRLRGPANHAKLVALIDSGADCTVLFKDNAEYLGIELTERNQTNVVGVGGVHTAWTARVDVELQEKHQTYRFSVPVRIMNHPSEGHPILLGRAGFFEHFEITFKERDHRVYLKPENNDAPAHR